ncbi:MAG: arginase family protein [archaeon]
MLHTSKSFTTNYPLEEADVVFLGIPFDSTAYSEGNQRYGPLTIKQALKHRTSYQPDLKINPLKELKIHDAGEIDIVPGNYSKTENIIEETIDEIKETNPNAFIVSLGGEHLISLAIAKSLNPKTIVQLDAHKDLDEDLNGNKFAHNTWVKRIKEEKPEIELIQKGTRQYSEYKNEEIKIKNMENLNEIEEPIYLTIDMDIFDPCYAPDVAYPEPFGKNPEEVDEILNQLFRKKIIGMDICEVSSKQINNRTSYLASWLILRALSRLQKNKV